MLLENIALGRTIEIYIDREGYRYHLTSKVEETTSKRILVSLIASHGKVFKFEPNDLVTIVYRDADQMWQWRKVKAGIGKMEGTLVHYFEITSPGNSFNRRNAYRVTMDEEIMIGYYDLYDSDVKSDEAQLVKPEEESEIPADILMPKFVRGMVRDVSETGIGICTNFMFKLDDSMFFSIPSPYGRLNVKAKVVRTKELRATKSKYVHYYGCEFIQNDNKLIKYIYDIQREALKKQRENEENEKLRLEQMKEREKQNGK